MSLTSAVSYVNQSIALSAISAVLIILRDTENEWTSKGSAGSLIKRSILTSFRMRLIALTTIGFNPPTVMMWLQYVQSQLNDESDIKTTRAMIKNEAKRLRFDATCSRINQHLCALKVDVTSKEKRMNI